TDYKYCLRRLQRTAKATLNQANFKQRKAQINIPLYFFVICMADVIVPAIQEAFKLITSGDPEFYATIYRTIYVSSVGTLLACVWSIPVAVILGLYNFRGKWVIKGIFNALIGIPTVALGLFLYLLLSRQGELGSFHLLYTVNGIALGQAILVTPIIVSFVTKALETADMQLRDLAKTLGASGLRTDLTMMRETFWSMVLAVTAGFNRGFGELGIATIVGGSLFGNGTIFGGTRVLTTSIALEINFGHFSIAMAFAIILLTIVFALALSISLIERIRNEATSWNKLTFWRRFRRKLET
ncbi:MAG TPA: ABC transporter permease, partial [Candidatus Binatia bacterium]|nr:ABC transporter permease [Candidatus Binatia bacterium]